jgi:queuine tRNA-ribosyltransferase
MDFFQVIKQDQATDARLGIINTAHGPVHTPAFLAIGTRGSVKSVTAEELKFWGAEMILANTYHLWLRPSDALIHKAGGLHKFMGWDGPIFTDSGGFQVFSLGEKRNSDPNATSPAPTRVGAPSPSPGEGKRERSSSLQAMERGWERGRDSENLSTPTLKRVSDAGIEFQNELDGDLHLLTPELSIQIQSNLGSDIALVLDDVPGLPATQERIKKSLELTLLWAKRAKTHFEKVREASLNPLQRLYGIVQGGDFEKFRKKSVQELQKIGFDGYGIGGLAVGEDSATMYKVLSFTIPLLEEAKPRHLLGVGYPEQIVKAVSLGIDTFDCVLPTRNARHGQLFVSIPPHLSSPTSGEEMKEGVKFYQIITITNEQFKEDFTPVDNTCNCYGCLHHNRAYLRHLFMAGEPLAIRLATMHNLRFYLNLMEKIRRAIEFDSFAEMLEK